MPVQSHPEAVVYAVAARDLERARAYAKKHGIEKAYGGANGYQGASQLMQSSISFFSRCRRRRRRRHRRC